MNNTWKTIALATPVLSRRLRHPNNSLINNRLIQESQSISAGPNPGERLASDGTKPRLMLSFSHRYVYHACSEPCICLFFDVRLTIASRKTATKRMSTELPQEHWRKTPATFHSQHYVESRTNRFTFCSAPASPRIIRVQSLLWNGVESGRKAQASASGHARMRAPLCARHFGGDMRIESSHNGTKISFLFPSSGNRPPMRESRLRPQIQQPGVVYPVPASGVVVSG